MLNNQISDRLSNMIINQLKKKYFGTIKTNADLTSFINGVAAKVENIDGLSLNDPETFGDILSRVKPFVKELNDNLLKNKTGQMSTNIVESVLKASLNETSAWIPTSNPILKYEDSEIVKKIKAAFDKDFEKYTLLRIYENEGGPFINMDIAIKLDEEIGNDLELRRYQLAQIMGKFRSDFLTEISKVLPVININTAAYEFSKNDDQLKFEVTLLLSDNDQREWVSGKYKSKKYPEAIEESVKKKLKRDDKVIKEGNTKVSCDFTFEPGVEVFDKIEKLNGLRGVQANVINHNTIKVKWIQNYYSKEDLLKLMEATAHLVKAMPLAVAINDYKSHRIDMQMLETAIKACNRQELERFVLNQLGVKIQPEINKGNESQGADDKEVKQEGNSPF